MRIGDIEVIKIRPPPSSSLSVNAYLILGDEPVIVDTGWGGQSAVQTLRHSLEQMIEGVKITYIINTHAHPDHFGGNALVKSYNGSAEICVHREEAYVLRNPSVILERWRNLGRAPSWSELVQSYPSTDPDILLIDGQTVETKTTRLKVIHTPGHSPGHICLLDMDRGTLFCGDLVVGEKGSYIGEPDGDILKYEDSLRRVQALDIHLMLPAHGPPITDPSSTLNAVLRHQAEREAQILDILSRGEKKLEEIASTIYRDDPKVPSHLASLATKERLRKLVMKGKVHSSSTDRAVFYSKA